MPDGSEKKSNPDGSERSTVPDGSERKSIQIKGDATTLGGKASQVTIASDQASKSSIFTFAFADIEEEDLEEVEVTAQITVPPDGGWGWVVVATSFCIGFVNDGVLFTFGSLLSSVAKGLSIGVSLAAYINSVTVASYYLSGPIVSGLINRYGFRYCAMTGAVITSFSTLITVFANHFAAFIIFYGLIAGFGFAMSNMPAVIIVGFYFHRLRSIALTIAVTGCSVGIVFFNQFNSYMARVVGWQAAILGQSTIFALSYFFSMTYRPLLSMSVVQTTDEEEETKTLSHIPTLSRTKMKSFARVPSTIHGETLKGKRNQRLFNAVSNMNFPTAATIIEDVNEANAEVSIISLDAPGPSNRTKSRVTLVPHNAEKPIQEKDLNRVKSMIAQSQANTQKKAKFQDDESESKIVDIQFSVPEKQIVPHKRGLKSLFHWEKHVEESRPMYRDDVFYEKKFEPLPSTREEDEEDTIEYQLKVSRAAATSDLKERGFLCTTAFRRVLATMLDTALLKRKSFILICLSMFMIYVGYLTPFVFIAERGKSLGISHDHCSMFVSVIGFSGIVGRFVQGGIAMKVHPIAICVGVYSIAGIGTALSGFGKSAGFQIAYCFIYGFMTSSTTTIRSITIVKLYGLENLTNGTGIVVMFQGFGCLLCTPLAGLLKDLLGFQAAFIFSGACITIGALLTIPVVECVKREDKEKARKTSVKIPRTRSVIVRS